MKNGDIFLIFAQNIDRGYKLQGHVMLLFMFYVVCFVLPDQYLCFRNIGSKISLFHTFEISNI